MLNHLRNPKNLWKTLNILWEGNTEFNDKLEIHLSGNIDAEVITEIESHPHLKTKVMQLGYLSHAEVLAEYNEASVLLLLLFNSKSGIGNYPGKIFEYFAAKRSVLAFGPENSDAEKLIEKTKAGIYFSYDEMELKKEILNLFHNDRTPLESTEIEGFSRKKLTEDLSALLNSIK